jgi:hypothetical protein
VERLLECSPSVLLAQEEVDRLGIAKLDEYERAHGSEPIAVRRAWHCPDARRPSGIEDDDQPGHTSWRLPAIHSRHVQNAETAAREMGGLSLADALLLCELLANTHPARYERAALRWASTFIDERLPPLSEVALAASGEARGHSLDRCSRTVPCPGQLRIAEVSRPVNRLEGFTEARASRNSD